MAPSSSDDTLYRYPHSAANEPVVLHEGPIALPSGVTGSGRLVLGWQPSTGLRFEADLDSLTTPMPGERHRVNVAGSEADVLISSLNRGFDPRGPFARVTGSVSRFTKGTPTGLRDLGFQVVNFSDFFTPGVQPSPGFGSPPHVGDLAHAGWRIRLAAVPQFKDIFKSVSETGGYAFTHVGRLERSDGSLFEAQDAEPVLDALRRFLSFARGAACSLPVRWGRAGDGRVTWEEWGSQPVDPWRGRSTWFDENHGGLLSDLFDPFAQTRSDPDLWPPFSLALHWYQSSNIRAGGMEGSIILGLTALDLLGAMVVVDRAGLMSDRKYDDLVAKDKLARLLDVLRVGNAIPAKLTNLASFAAANKWPTASETLAEVRHGYVHSNRRRRQVVLSASNLATFEAWQLSLWYQELALLHLLGHRGEYRNRLTTEWLGQVEKVPWV